MAAPFKKKRSSYWWIAYPGPNGLRMQESTKTTSRIEARHVLAARLTNVREGKVFDIQAKPANIRFDALADDFTRSHRLIFSSRGIESNLKNLRAFFGKMLIDGISGVEILRFREYRRKQPVGKGRIRKVGDSTINRDLSALRAIYNWAKTEEKYKGLAKDNPVIAKKHFAKEPPAPRAYLDVDMKRRLLDGSRVKKRDPRTFPRPLFNDICQVLWVTGLRVEELLGLTVGQVRFSEGLVEVEKCKGNEARLVPFRMPWIAAIFQAHCQDKKDGDLAISFNGIKIEYSTLARVFRKACKEAEFRGNVTIHSLRKTAATDMALEGLDVLVVQRILGHKDIETTLRYVDRMMVADTKIKALGQKSATLLQHLGPAREALASGGS